MTTSCTELLEALRANASPLPWHTTPDADANNQYTVVAVNHFAACVKALEEETEDCPPGCAEQHRQWRLSGVDVHCSCEALADLRRALEAALEHADGQ